MKYIFYLFTMSLFFSCQTNKSLAQDSGKVIIEKIKNDSDSTLIYGFVSELSTGDRLKLSDIWVENQRFDCDTNGKFQIQVRPGKHKVEARSFGFENFKCKINIERGERQKLVFYIVPYKNKKLSNQIH